MSASVLVSGRTANTEHAGFVRTPPALAERIVHHLLTFPPGPCTVLDPTAGEGDLLLPASTVPGVYALGVEISAERAEVARSRLPRERSSVLIAPIETVSIPAASLSLVLANPPYFFVNGKRAEYRILKAVGAALVPGGILVAILPARSAWDATMVEHWARYYDQIGIWKFPAAAQAPDAESAFERFSQICVVGVRRAHPYEEVPPELKKGLLRYRWRRDPRRDRDDLAAGFWEGHATPPELPTTPLHQPYQVPSQAQIPRLVLRQADEAQLLEALPRSGAHLSADWAQATTWAEEALAGAPAMPYTGPAHIASELLTGLLDGEIFAGPGTPDDPHAAPHLFVAFVSSIWVEMRVSREEQEKLRQQGVVRVGLKQLQDLPVLGALNLATGEWRYYQQGAVFTFLAPWLELLTQHILRRRQPRYQLDPADWELRVLAQFGIDKRLPNAVHPGLAPAQIHRVCALHRVVDTTGAIAIQGEPGTGKTRMTTALAALMAYHWRRRTNPSFRLHRQPRWIKGLRRAWLKNPRTLALLDLEPVRASQPPPENWPDDAPAPTRVIGYRERGSGRLLAPESVGPRALPVLVATPKRVIKEYGQEIRAAWPEAEVVHLDTYQDIPRWLARCAQSSAPAVFGIVSHSKTLAQDIRWQPAVLERTQVHVEPELEPDEALRPELQEIVAPDGHRIQGYRVRATGDLLTKEVRRSRFFCPDCGELIQALPRSLHRVMDEAQQQREPPTELPPEDLDETDPDLPIKPVASRTWFESKPRWHTCGHVRNQDREVQGKRPLRAALAQKTRKESTLRTYPPLPFATWSRLMHQLVQRAEREAASASEAQLLQILGQDRGLQERLLTAALAHEPIATQLYAAARPMLDVPPAADDRAGWRSALLRQVAIDASLRRILLRLARDLITWTPIFVSRVFAEAAQPRPQTRSSRARRGHNNANSRPVGERALRLHPSLNGPLQLEEPDLEIVADATPLPGVNGQTRIYRLPDGRRLREQRQSGSAQISGYVEEATGHLLTREQRYAFGGVPADSFSHYEYLYRFYRGCVALPVIDESHNGRGRDSDIAAALHKAMLAGQTRVPASGTHFGGDILSFYHYWLRAFPGLFRRLGLGWRDAAVAQQRYGAVQIWTKEYESDARKGSGQTTIRTATVPAPGLSARLIPHLLESLVYLTVLDVGAFMPPRIEIPELVGLDDDPPVQAAWQQVQELEQQAHSTRLAAQQRLEAIKEAVLEGRAERETYQAIQQEAEQAFQQCEIWHDQAKAQRQWAVERDLLRAYIDVVRRLQAEADNGNTTARMGLGTIPRWFATLPCSHPFELRQTYRDDWGDTRAQRLLLRTPRLAWDHLYPVERRLRALVEQELSEGRRLLIYVDQNGERSMPQRLQWVLQEQPTWVLGDKIAPEDRQQAILDAVRAGHQIIICQYRRVNEGLNLQSAIDTIIWYEMAMNLFLLDQASRRAWRLGKTEEVRIYYLAYAGTAAHSKLRKLGGQSGAAAAFAGETARGALVEHAGADQTTLARLSATLEGEAAGAETEATGNEPEEEEEEDVAMLLEQLQTGASEAEALKAAFARRAEEERTLLERGRQWTGIVDTLPARLDALFAKLETAGKEAPSLWVEVPAAREIPLPDQPPMHVVEATAASAPAGKEAAPSVSPKETPAASSPQPVGGVHPTSLPEAQAAPKDTRPAAAVRSDASAPAQPAQAPANRPLVQSDNQTPEGAIQGTDPAVGSRLTFGNLGHIKLARQKGQRRTTRASKPRVRAEVRQIPALDGTQEGTPAAVPAVIARSLWELLAEDTISSEPPPRPAPTSPAITPVPRQASLW